MKFAPIRAISDQVYGGTRGVYRGNDVRFGQKRTFMSSTTGRIIGLFPPPTGRAAKGFGQSAQPPFQGGHFNRRQLECGTLKLERIDPIMVRDLAKVVPMRWAPEFLRAESNCRDTAPTMPIRWELFRLGQV